MERTGNQVTLSRRKYSNPATYTWRCWKNEHSLVNKVDCSTESYQQIEQNIFHIGSYLHYEKIYYLLMLAECCNCELLSEE